jgi:hypothetical protein
MNQHTPGPWHVQKYSKDKLFVNAEYAQVAHVLHTETRGLVTTIEQRTANARLIAAAPKLLEACEQAVQFVAKYTADHESVIGQRMVDKMVSAIEQAKGAA